MTVQNTNNKNIYIGNGATTVFPFTFYVIKENPEHIKVYVTNDEGIDVETDNYIIDMDAQTITYPKNGTPLAEGKKITIARVLPLFQLLNLVNQGPFFAEEIEKAFDKNVMILQQIDEKVSRTLKTAISVEGEKFDATLPLKAGKSIKVNDNGDGFELTEDPAKVLPLAQAAEKNANESAIDSKKSANDARDALQKVNDAIDTSRPLKTFTTFEQLSFTSTPTTLIALLEKIPANSQFVRYIGTNQYKSLGLPVEGNLVITKGQYTDYARLSLQNYGGDSNIRRAFFENWSKGQTKFKWSEVGKTFTTYASFGFEATPTLTELLIALPVNSKFITHANVTEAPILGLPSTGVLEITKGDLVEYAKITLNSNGGNGSQRRMWFENWVKGQSTFDWKEVAHAIPTLTSEQKTQIKNLAKAYLNNADGTFYYYGNLLRNGYATNNCWITSQQRWGINCETFVEMVWMGRSVDDFKGKIPSTYSPQITKAFDWGYYWKFDQRTLLAGLAKRDENGNIIGYYNFHQPNKDDAENPYKGSYSYNTYYYPTSNNLYNQAFMTFMVAGDMAYELWKMGCEIPISELDVGDIIFNSAGERYGEVEDYTKGCWKRIAHVSMVYDKADDGTLTIVESSDFYGAASYPIYIANEKSTITLDKFRAYDVQRDCVKAFRHPAAFGKGGNVPDAITVVPKAYEG